MSENYYLACLDCGSQKLLELTPVSSERHEAILQSGTCRICDGKRVVTVEHLLALREAA